MRFDRDDVGHNLGYDVRDSARRRGLCSVPRVFQLVEPLIGEPHQLALAFSIAGINRYAVIKSGMDSHFQRRDFGFELIAHAAAKRVGLLGFGLRQEQRELVAADAEGKIGSAQGAAKRTGRELQHLIALQVAEAIIDVLELVQVEDDDGQVLDVALGAVEFLVAVLVEKASIVEAGERVGGGVYLQFLEFVILHEDGHAQKIHRDASTSTIAVFKETRLPKVSPSSASHQNQLPIFVAFRFGKLDGRGSAEKLAQKLSADGLFQSLRVSTNRSRNESSAEGCGRAVSPGLGYRVFCPK